MARAKRTDRAEARRRYRAYQATQMGEGAEAAEEDEAPAVPAAAVSGRRATPAPSGTSAGPARMGFIAAFRGAMRQANLREDVQYLPRLLLTRSVLLPSAIALGSGVLLTLPGAADNEIVRLVAPTILGQPILLTFLAGILAPRASYLPGAIAPFAAWAGLAIAIASITGPEAVPAEKRSEFLTQWLFAYLPMGVLSASFAAFYKRWLRLMSPARQSRQAGKPRRR